MTQPLFDFEELRDRGQVPGNIPSCDICSNFHKDNPESVKANRRVDKIKQSKLICEALARSNSVHLRA
jgi:hypothetical protein